MKVLLCVSALVLVSVNAKVGDVCQDESTCDPGECCLEPVDSLIVSKKRFDFGPILEARNATCQNYLLEGADCESQDIWDGVTCPCETGSMCISRQKQKFFSGFFASRALPPSQPGYTSQTKCERNNEPIPS
ncbi:putative toxin II precursor [Aplysia californica]|uniref:Putative toxin II n=1 Tax=Aplysia californica TaxID=6500 RepID=A1X2J7_APLCA|nr:putative toxin II precursor [Aplysia californica]AAZ29039.1 putative toxin II [Aplysia californica]